MRLAVLLVVPVLGIAFVASAAPQAASIEPMSPRAGEALTVRYRPDDPSAKLVSNTPRFAALTVRTIAGDATLWGELTPFGSANELAASFNLPVDATAGAVYLFSLDPGAPFDPALESTFVMERASGAGIAAALSPPDVVDHFRRWRADHPTDCGAVLDAWDALARSGDAAGEIEALLPDLDIANADGGASLNALRVIGRARVRKFDEAIMIAKEIVERFPTDPWTDGAIGELLERSGAAADSSRADAMRPVLMRLAELAPASQTLRRGGLALLVADGTTAPELIERCADAWIASREGDASPLVLQAKLRLARDVDVDRTESLLSRAIEALLGPADRAYSDPHRELIDRRLREALLLRSTLAARKNDGPAALLFAMAARGATEQDDAVTAAAARDAIASSWRLMSGKRGAVPVPPAATVAEVATEAAVAPAAVTDGAPDFTLKDMNGSDVSVSGLRGKVVVINFWFVGCAPCRLEIPLLNAMTERFAGKNVEFLAPALDSVDRCREFLATTEFRYRTLANANSAAGAYHVKAYPTHVVIDKAGRIALLRVGGGDAAVKDITSAIEAALGGQ